MGMIFGTAAYMSPELAAGKLVDKRADIWSFGVVFWEMLTGKRFFDGETISHTLADVPVVAAATPFRRVFLVTEMMAQIGVHGPLNQGFGQLVEQALRADNLFRALAG
jgi:serine/threonine protein kinase